MQYLLLLLNTVLISIAQLILKKSSLNTVDQKFIVKLFDIYFIFGLFLYGISTLLWIKILSKTNISIAYPVMGLSYAIVVMGGYFIFNEELNLTKIIGVVLILAGIGFIAK